MIKIVVKMKGRLIIVQGAGHAIKKGRENKHFIKIRKKGNFDASRKGNKYGNGKFLSTTKDEK